MAFLPERAQSVTNANWFLVTCWKELHSLIGMLAPRASKSSQHRAAVLEGAEAGLLQEAPVDLELRGLKGALLCVI